MPGEGFVRGPAHPDRGVLRNERHGAPRSVQRADDHQADLPEVGSKVTVEGWHQRGWVHRLALFPVKFTVLMAWSGACCRWLWSDVAGRDGLWGLGEVLGAGVRQVWNKGCRREFGFTCPL